MQYSAEQFTTDLMILSSGFESDEHKFERAYINGMMEENIYFCKVLLCAGMIKSIDYQCNDYEDYTVLMFAVEGSYEELVKILIEKGANLELRNIYGHTALMLTTNCKIISMLLDAGANIDVIDSDGRTSLMYAVKSNNIDTTKLLIDRGASVNICDNKGNTTLDYAPNDKFVKLLEGKKTVEGKCSYGKSCLNLAKGMCKLEHEILCSYGQKCLNHARGVCSLEHWNI